MRLRSPHHLLVDAPELGLDSLSPQTAGRDRIVDDSLVHSPMQPRILQSPFRVPSESFLIRTSRSPNNPLLLLPSHRLQRLVKTRVDASGGTFQTRKTLVTSALSAPLRIRVIKLHPGSHYKMVREPAVPAIFHRPRQLHKVL